MYVCSVDVLKKTISIMRPVGVMGPTTLKDVFYMQTFDIHIINFRVKEMRERERVHFRFSMRVYRFFLNLF